MTDRNDARTVLQAHKLRSELASTALIHGTGQPRGRSIPIKLLVISLILAAVIVVGIVVTGYMIDLIQARTRSR
ncbi:hypothetical protein [Gordonia sp. NPDC003585]|uniref:hypothetical protein n=1 Tax=Gordonia sp. NPDC003585 TaxID=3154275 RepID=UPI0033BC9317